ncbi:MAG: hypothetical protein AB7N76_32430 [Planctomycetota bacterium]
MAPGPRERGGAMRWQLLLAVLVGLGAEALADTVVLTDGRTFENVEAVWVDQGERLEIRKAYGSIFFPKAQVKSVVKRPVAEPPRKADPKEAPKAERPPKPETRPHQPQKKELLLAYAKAEEASVRAGNAFRLQVSEEGSPRTVEGLKALAKRGEEVAQLERLANEARKRAGLPALSDLPGIRNVQKDAEETDEDRQKLDARLKAEVERVNRGRRAPVPVPKLPPRLAGAPLTLRADTPKPPPNDADTPEAVASLVELNKDRFKGTLAAQSPVFSTLAPKGRGVGYALVALLPAAETASPEWFRLEVYVQSPSWLFVEEAVEEGGAKVFLTKLDSGTTKNGAVFEQLGLIFKRTDLPRLARAGLSVRLYGKRDNLDLKVPAHRFAGFLLFLDKRYGTGWAAQPVSNEALKGLLDPR